MMDNVRLPLRQQAGVRTALLVVALITTVASGLIVSQPGMPVYLLGLMAAAGYVLLCLSRPFAAFTILLLSALTVWLSGIRVVGGVSVMVGVGLVFTSLWLTRVLLHTTKFVKVKEYKWLAALAIVVFFSTWLHLDGQAGFTAVLTYFQLFLLCVLVINLTTTPQRLDSMGYVIVFSSVSLAALILLDQVGWLPPQLIPEQNLDMAPGVGVMIPRTGGLWGDANVTALQLTIALPFIMAAWPEASRPMRTLLLATGGAIITAFVWTFSMGGLMGLSVMLLARMLMAPQRHRLFVTARNGLIGIIALSAFLAFVPELFVQRVVVMFESNAAALGAFDRASLLTIGTLRGDAWWAALQAVSAAPWLGYGPGNGVYAIASYSLLRSQVFLSPHNMLLAVAGDLGLIGLALFAALFAAALLAVRPKANAPATNIGLSKTRDALFIAMIGYAVQGMALEIHNMKLLWILLGMAIACREMLSRSATDHLEATR